MMPNPKEIKEAVFSIGSLKAPGEDGLHAFLYHKSWDTIRDDCVNMVQQVFQSGNIPEIWIKL